MYKSWVFQNLWGSISLVPTTNSYPLPRHRLFRLLAPAATPLQICIEFAKQICLAAEAALPSVSVLGRRATIGRLHRKCSTRGRRRRTYPRRPQSTRTHLAATPSRSRRIGCRFSVAMFGLLGCLGLCPGFVCLIPGLFWVVSGLCLGHARLVLGCVQAMFVLWRDLNVFF